MLSLAMVLEYQRTGLRCGSSLTLRLLVPADHVSGVIAALAVRAEHDQSIPQARPVATFVLSGCCSR